jgi:MarR-like DNA-binding transcriptional regulator SgrR of sgrS sRNA
MKPIWFPSLAAVSAFLLVGVLDAASRPQYGGELRIQLIGALPQLDPALDSANIDYARAQAIRLFAETLVRIDDRGVPKPELSTSWRSESDDRVWRFTIRARVLFHDGTPATGTAIAEILSPVMVKLQPGLRTTGTVETLTIESPRSLPALLYELAKPEYAVVRHGSDNILIGTGPFLLTAPQTNLLSAFEDHWAGRPYLDSVQLVPGSGQPSVSFSPAGPEVWELPANINSRTIPDRFRISSSAPLELLALLAEDVPSALCEPLSLAIDRQAIINVLAQRRGQPAASLLPQWITGYAFLFAQRHDPVRAAGLVKAMQSAPLTLGYSPEDQFARSVAERISVNARDASLVIRPMPLNAGQPANLRLIRIPVAAALPQNSLDNLASRLGAPGKVPVGEPVTPEALFETEKSLIEDRRIIPLAHLPRLFAVQPRVRNWSSSRAGELRIEDVWLAPPAKP